MKIHYYDSSCRFTYLNDILYWVKDGDWIGLHPVQYKPHKDQYLEIEEKHGVKIVSPVASYELLMRSMRSCERELDKK